MVAATSTAAPPTKSKSKQKVSSKPKEQAEAPKRNGRKKTTSAADAEAAKLAKLFDDLQSQGIELSETGENEEDVRAADQAWREQKTHSPWFKRWFGDWEKAEHKRFLEGKPVAQLTGNEFQKSLVPLTTQVAKWFQQQHNGVAIHPELGKVILDERGVKDSIGHGLGRNKAAAFAAVPDVIRKGRVAHVSPVRGENAVGDMHHVIAPISLGGRNYAMDVMVRVDQNTRRMYVHEVALIEKLQQSAFKTGALSTDEGAHTGATAGAIKTLLRDIFSVKSSVVVNSDGTPKVVYHGTTFGGFNVFKTFGHGASDAAFFHGDSDEAQHRARGATSVYPVYLNLRNPLRLTTQQSAGIAGEVEAENEVINDAAAKGHDGIVFNADDPNLATYAVFDSSQIKSATANRGTFGPPDDISLSESEPDAPPARPRNPQLEAAAAKMTVMYVKEGVREWDGFASSYVAACSSATTMAYESSTHHRKAGARVA
jgi:hypothetical protein